ncbi:hypothetical protein GXW71_17295 [Roseomonas hellenica]|uniref:ATP-binding protein n=1 Tax=Plastoroseomonas hellenica TaxID=2687306 RepID=A0ABS5F0N9_9PROT|nr:ATP-binding protein [Plastoroseomonas hellenica]MBR0666119.1 hypothetical protein [Plastoroseomonas hellenica]
MTLVPVHFGADPAYLIRGLSTDISSMECIFDLIDNSIDAARNELLSFGNAKKDQRGLPDSYAGFHIDLVFTDSSLSIKDNCSGMEEIDLSRRAFRTGAKSRHPFGIGHFGVGLKRAIFKLGTSIALETDNGNGAFRFAFTEASVLAAGDQPLLAERRSSSGSKSTAIRITGLRSDVAADVRSSLWIDRLTDGVKRRYGIFTRKGIEIRLNGTIIGPFGPTVREQDVGPVRRAMQYMETRLGVGVFAEAGLHEDYRIKGLESDYDEARHRAISSEQGWYVVCNDRIILSSDRTERTGWTTGWHNEYAGFLGWVHYVSEDPELLPWDSKKAGINVSSEAHRESVIWLKGIADEFRAQKNRLRSRGDRQRSTAAPSSGKIPGRAADAPASGPAKDNMPAPSQNSPDPNRHDKDLIHTETHTTLFHTCKIRTSSPKVRSLADEAVRMEIGDFPYASALLLRGFFEIVLIDYLKRIKRYGEVKELVFVNQAAQGRPFSDAQKKNFSPTLDNVLEWLVKHEDAFPEHERRTCRYGCESFKGYVKKINGIVHEDGILTGGSQVTEFRNSVLPTLRILLEHNAP